MVKKVRSGREWSPRGPAEVWLVLWTGDWETDYEIYGSEHLAWKSVEKFMRRRLAKMPGENENQEPILEALAAGDIWSAYNLFTEYESSYANYLDVEKVKVQH